MASTERATLPLSAWLIGQPSLAASASWAKVAASRPGTIPLTVSADETTFQPLSTLSKVTVAVTSSDAGGVPLRPSPPEKAIA